MTKTAKTAPKKAARTSPGLRRLRKAPNAETIREAVLEDQATGRAAVVAEVEAAKATETPAKAPRARRAPQGPGRGRHARQRAPQGRPARRNPRRRRGGSRPLAARFHRQHAYAPQR